MKIPPLAAFLLFAAALLAALGWVWIPLPPTNEELVGYAGKLDYLVDLVRQEGGIPWWIPGYLSGYSGAAVMSHALGLAPYALAATTFDTITAFKVAGLLLMGAGGLAAYALGSRLSGSGWAGFSTGALYLLSPQVLLRLGWQEHMTIVTTYPLVPLCFLALWRVASSGSRLDAQYLAMAFSATLLCWPKIGATLVIPLALLGVWLYASRPTLRANLRSGFLWAAPLTFVLGALPLLPLLRETQFMTVFELGPFAGWQSAFSARTATSWIDRGGALFAGMPEGIRVSRGGYYLGLVPLAALAFLLSRTWRGAAEADRDRIGVVKMFTGIALAMFWLSFGPRSVVEGHFQFLESAAEMPDWVLPLHWLALGAQAVVIWWLLPGGTSKPIFFSGAAVVYFFVPAFRIIERIPLFGDIRAPDTFWILGGTVAWCVAGGIAIWWTIARIRRPATRCLLAAAALAAVLADATPYLRTFSEGALDEDLFRDFAETQDFLRDRPVNGRVLPISGRYFYLQTPAKSGRSLVTEAAHHNFMARDAARLQAAAWKSAPAMAAYANLAGVSHILVDKTDPGTSADMQRWLRSIWPGVFENDHFLVLENRTALYPAFTGSGSNLAHPDDVDDYTHALIMSTHGALALPPGAPPPSAAKSTQGLQVIPPANFQSLSATGIEFTKSAGPEWVVASEAWHPDWRATVDTKPAALHRVAGAFPGVLAESGTVVFRFSPPWWYPACTIAATGAWVLAILSLPIQRRFHQRSPSP